jgi:hypothetical protein
MREQGDTKRKKKKFIGPGGFSSGRGTMLPVHIRASEFRGRTHVIDDFNIEKRDHSSVKSWRIQADGSVRIDSVGFLTQTGKSSKTAKVRSDVVFTCLSVGMPPKALTTSIKRKKNLGYGLTAQPAFTNREVNVCILKFSEMEHQDLSRKLEPIAVGCKIYTVALHCDANSQQGPLVAELDGLREQDGPTRLIKVGTYLVDDFPPELDVLPLSTHVDWIVL